MLVVKSKSWVCFERYGIDNQDVDIKIEDKNWLACLSILQPEKPGSLREAF